MGLRSPSSLGVYPAGLGELDARAPVTLAGAAVHPPLHGDEPELAAPVGAESRISTCGDWAAWRQLAEHVGDSLAKGNRVIVVGQLRARSWETPEGERRTVVEVQAEEVGPSLRWATAKPERATTNGKPSGQFNDAPPF